MSVFLISLLILYAPGRQRVYLIHHIFSAVEIINSFVTTPQLSGIKNKTKHLHSWILWVKNLERRESRISFSLFHDSLRLSSMTQMSDGVT